MRIEFRKVACVKSAVSSLRDQMSRPIGAGLYATTSVHPTDPSKVIKVGSGYARVADGTHTPLDGYADWLLTMHRHQSESLCPFMPRIDKAVLLHDDTQERCGYVVVMERLRVFKSLSENQRVGLLQQIVTTSDRLYDLVAMAQLLRTLDKGEVTRQVTPVGMTLISALAEVLERRSSDLHMGNVMVRRNIDGSMVPVITDPVT